MTYVTLADYEFAQKTSKGGSSKYTNFFAEVAKSEPNQWFDCAEIMDKGRTIAHNKTNISSCAGKLAAKENYDFKFAFRIAKNKVTGVETLLCAKELK